MNQIKFNCFPGGRRRCLTMSYDDGSQYDKRLTEIFAKYGIRGTFHVNSGTVFKRFSAEELRELYAGQELSCHMVTHPFPNAIPEISALQEILEDKRTLENATGTIIRGMSYPFGRYTPRVIDLARDAGMEYARTTQATDKFGLPDDFMLWHPTCHHNQSLMEHLERFLAPGRYDNMKLFYVWGHSHEFAQDDNWDLIENFCKEAGGREDIWYATNIEIVDYVTAMRGLRFSADLDRAYNPAAVDVWISVNKSPVCCKSGEITSFGERITE